MRARTPNPIDFGDGRPWVACSQVEAQRLSKTPEVSPLAIRVLFAAMGRVRRDGHAPFEVGELRNDLPLLDKATGALRKPSAQAISDAIGQAKSLGFIAWDSNARCLVLSGHAFQKANGAGSRCVHHT